MLRFIVLLFGVFGIVVFLSIFLCLFGIVSRSRSHSDYSLCVSRQKLHPQRRTNVLCKSTGRMRMPEPFTQHFCSDLCS